MLPDCSPLENTTFSFQRRTFRLGVPKKDFWVCENNCAVAAEAMGRRAIDMGRN